MIYLSIYIYIYIYGVSLGLTVAGLDALKPPVISVSIADTSTVLIPSTPRSAATLSAGFLERATFGARRRFSEG